jgi:hypothetical protein
MVYPIGDQRVGIERDTPVLDEGKQPVYGEIGGPLVAPTTVWVDDALFEAVTIAERHAVTTTVTDEVARAVLPVSYDGVIPAVDDDGEDASFSFLNEDGTIAILSGDRLIHNGLRYELQGDAVLEMDIRGRGDHVRAVCSRPGG